MAMPEVQECPNAGAKAAIAVNDQMAGKNRNGERLSKNLPTSAAFMTANRSLNGYPARMAFHKMLSELRAERDQLAEAILVLERLAAGRGKRRGRPPAWMNTLKRRGRPPGSKNKPKDD